MTTAYLFHCSNPGASHLGSRHLTPQPTFPLEREVPCHSDSVLPPALGTSAGWGTRRWAGPECQRLIVEQGNMEAESWTSQTGVYGGDGTEGGREWIRQ